MDDDDFMEGDTDSALAALPFEMADRLSDEHRQTFGGDAAHAQWDLLIQSVAGAATVHGVPITAEEKDLLVRGLRWVGEPDEMADVTVVGASARAELSARWRFEPAPPAGDEAEAFLVEFCRRTPEARALVTAWRHGPDGRRARLWCLVVAAGADAGQLWGLAVIGLEKLDVFWNVLLHQVGVLVEAVAAEGHWPAYHRRLLRAAAPVWVAPGFALGAVVAAQPRPLTLARLRPDDLVFPGVADHDAVDALVAGWAAHAHGVAAAVRAWSQPGRAGRRAAATVDGDERTRVYGVVVDGDALVAPVRDACVETVARATGGPVAIEVVARRGRIPAPVRALLGAAVVLWERDGPARRAGPATR